MWVVDMLLKLNGPFSDQLIHLWDTTISYCLSVMHMSLWLCVFVIIRRDHRVKISQKSLPFSLVLAFVFHPHQTIAHCLHFVSMAWTSRLLGSFKILQKHRYILLLLLLLFVAMIMNNSFKFGFDIHYWSISYCGCYRIILIQFLTFSLGTLTWSTQLTKSITVPKAVTKKKNMIYICSKHAQDQYYGFSFENLAPILLISDYYHLIIGQMIKFYFRWQYDLFS